MHEAAIAYRRKVTLAEIFADGYLGVVDPGAAIIYRDELHAAFDGCPTVLIRRNENASHLAFTTWLKFETPNWDQLVAGLEWFQREFNPLVVDFDHLDDANVVNAIVRHVLGRDMDERVFRLFDTLDVQQHRAKAEARLKEVVWE